MKKHFLLLLVLLNAARTTAQQPDRTPIDSLIAVLSTAKPDTSTVKTYVKLLQQMSLNHDPRASSYFGPALALARDLRWESGTARVHAMVAKVHWSAGEFDQALVEGQEALALFEKVGDRERMAQQLADLGQVHLDAGRYTEAHTDLKKALDLYTQLGNKGYQAFIHGLLYYLLDEQGDPAGAIKEIYAQIKLQEEIADKYAVAIATSNLADMQAQLGHLEDALASLNVSFEMLLATRPGDMVNLASIQRNIGDVYIRMRRLPEAEDHYREALAIAVPANVATEAGLAYEGLGRVHQLQGDDAAALSDFLRAAERIEQGGFEKTELADLYSRIGMSYTRMGRFAEAETFFDRIDRISKDVDSRHVLASYHRGTEFLDSTRGNWRQAYVHSKLHIIYQDSILGTENREKIAQAQVRYDYDKEMLADSLTFEADKAVQAKEIQKQKAVRNGFMFGFALMVAFAGVFFFQRNRISREKARSEELLLNILPEEIAEELKAKGEAEAVQIDQVSVLFTDFKGFTAMSEKVTPKDLVRDLNECFSAFDHITEKYGIEKIKTIGDAYMAAGGLPTPNTTHATDVINAALEMRDFVAEGKARKVAAGLPYFEIRIGIHTGPVVAGIVGVKKFQYDIWGDTVNTASRMESSGEVGQVNISEATYALVKDVVAGSSLLVDGSSAAASPTTTNQQPATNNHQPTSNQQPSTTPAFHFTPRGKVEAKGKGEMEMFFVRRSSEGGKENFVRHS